MRRVRPAPGRDARGDAAAARAAGRGTGHAAGLPGQDALPAVGHAVLREHQEVTEAIVNAAADAGVATLELRYSPLIHTYAGLTVAAVHPRGAVGDEPRVAPRRHAGRPDRDRDAPARAAHREDPGAPGHRRGAAPARAAPASSASTSPAPSAATRRACSGAPTRSPVPVASGPHRPRRRGRARRLRLGGHGRPGRDAHRPRLRGDRRSGAAARGWPATASWSSAA